MAYSNYEGKVWRNGEHFHDGCNGEVMQDRLRRDMEPWGEPRKFMYHALLGQGPVRIGLRKTSPVLLVEHDDLLFDPYGLEGEVREGGYRAHAYSIGNHATAVLIEPDGTVWVGMAAYEAYDDWCDEDGGDA